MRQLETFLRRKAILLDYCLIVYMLLFQKQPFISLKSSANFLTAGIKWFTHSPSSWLAQNTNCFRTYRSLNFPLCSLTISYIHITCITCFGHFPHFPCPSSIPTKPSLFPTALLLLSWLCGCCCLVVVLWHPELNEDSFHKLGWGRLLFSEAWASQ